MLLCQFWFLNAAPTAKVHRRMQADPCFPMCHIRAQCLCGGGGGRVLKKIMDSFRYFGHFFVYSPYLQTDSLSLGVEEGISKLYFVGENWKNNKGHIPVKIGVLKTSFSKGTFRTLYSLSIDIWFYLSIYLFPPFKLLLCNNFYCINNNCSTTIVCTGASSWDINTSFLHIFLSSSLNV